MLYYFDLFGVFAFAFLGARVGIAQKYGLLGVYMCGFLTALGGGTIRELILHHTPFYFYNVLYGLIILGAVLLSVGLHRYFKIIKPYVLTADAIGVITFAFIGIRAADQAQLGLFGMAFFAVLTAYGGGALCDLITHQAPRIFRHSLHTLPSIALAAAYWISMENAYHPAILVCMLMLALVAQLVITFSPPRWFRFLAATAPQSAESSA